MDYILKDAEENFLLTVAVGVRKREVGLLVHATLTAVTKELKIATVLLKMV